MDEKTRERAKQQVLARTLASEAEEHQLRDYFAGLAMQNFCTGDGAVVLAQRDERYDETNWAEVVALNSYEIADAMIEERRKRRGGQQ